MTPRIDIEAIFRQAQQRETAMLREAEPLPLTPDHMRRMVAERLESQPGSAEAIRHARQELAAAQLGLSAKGVLIAGQCAPDSRSLENGRIPALEVPLALHAEAQKYHKNLTHIPRVCWKKPRSSKGSPGLYHQPGGALFSLREVYLPLIERGVPFAYELLDPDDPLQDAATYTWLGARSVGHNPLWYAMAANPTCPIGLKNGENGRFSKIADVAAAIRTNTPANLSLANGETAHVTTAGNHLINAIYRGGDITNHRLTEPNDFRRAFQQSYLQFCRESYRAHTRVLLDCSHGNAKFFTGGRRSEQGQLDCFAAFEDLILENPTIIAAGEFDAPRDITVLDMSMGVMAEVNLLPGRNEPGAPALPGRSDVDACLAIEQGYQLQERLAALYEHHNPSTPLWSNHPAYTTAA